MIRLKRERANAKRTLTNTVKEISAALACRDSEDEESFRRYEEKLQTAFATFQKACESFKAMLTEEEDIEECCVYFRDGQERFLSAMQQVHDVGNLEIPLIQPIQPNDSASQVSQSRKSDISKYSKSSSSSSSKSALEKRMLQNATRKATLVAEERMLARRQSLAYQELKLSQLREEFHLQEELTKLDAEKEVFEEVLKSDGKITSSVFNPEKSISSLGRF